MGSNLVGIMLIIFGVAMTGIGIFFNLFRAFGMPNGKLDVENADYVLNLGSKKDFGGHGLFKLKSCDSREGGFVISLFPIDFKLFKGDIPKSQLSPISPKFVRTENFKPLQCSGFRNCWVIVPEILDDFSGMEGTILGDLLKESAMSLESEHSEKEFYKVELEKSNRLIAGIGEAFESKNFERLKDLVGGFQQQRNSGGGGGGLKPVQNDFG